MIGILNALTLSVLALAAPVPSPSPSTAASGCSGPLAHRLDFWIGTWDVRNPAGGREGHNVIERVLGGCAILEHWSDADGSEGKSLFYIDGPGRRWKQVWVTDTGAFKEKAEILGFTGGIRFQGEIPLPDGRRIQDRTTLSVLPDGRVRQLIEQSADGGQTWRAWEGLYSRFAQEGR
jgi:hypothetical protein